MVEQCTARCRRSPGQKALSAWQGAKEGKQGPGPQGYLSSPGLSFLERTCGPQLCFSSRPRKAAKQVGDARTNCNDWGPPALPLTSQCRPWPWKGTPGKLMNILLKSSPETSPKIPACKGDKSLKTKEPVSLLSFWGAAHPFPFPSPTSFLTNRRLLNSKAMGSRQLVPGWSPEPVPQIPFFWLPSELRQPSLGSPVASPMLSLSLFHCLQL